MIVIVLRLIPFYMTMKIIANKFFFPKKIITEFFIRKEVASKDPFLEKRLFFLTFFQICSDVFGNKLIFHKQKVFKRVFCIYFSFKSGNFGKKL